MSAESGEMTEINLTSDICLRPAAAVDQSRITAIIRDANINPFSLKWERFLLAEDNHQIVGTGQIKLHGDGSFELASIAVIPDRQGQGIGTLIVRELMAQHTQSTGSALYLTCKSTNEPFYTRFGFQRIERAALTPYFRRITRVAAVLIGIGRILRPRSTVYLAVMRYGPPQASQ